QIFGDARWNVFELRSRLGIITSDLHQRFVHGNSAGSISGGRAVLSGFFARQGFVDDKMVTDAMREKAADALERMEAAHLVGKVLDEMSTGEGGRAACARG